MSISFTGVIAGIKYTDPQTFEKAARDAGYRPNKGRTRDWRVGLPVRIKLQDGTYVEGQVWCKSDVKGYVWVALDNGKYAEIHTGSGAATGRHRSLKGQVAA